MPYYAVFRKVLNERPSLPQQSPGLKLLWWTPTWTNIFPPHHSGFRFFIFWLMDRFKLFGSNQYAVLIIEGERGQLVHRTCVIPAWLQFPFMRSRDVQLGDVFTTKEMRGAGIAFLGLRHCLSQIAAPAHVFYIAQPTNTPSHLLAQKAGFDFFRLARKHPTKMVGYYSLAKGDYDYSLLRRIADRRLAPRHADAIVEESLKATPSASPPSHPLRVLAVIPRSAGPSAMIFAQRQMDAMSAFGHKVEIFDLVSRRNALGLLKAINSYRKKIRDFRPDVIHAHYGAMTSFFSVFAAFGLAPVVVTYRGSDLNPVPSQPLWQTLPSHILSKIAALGAAHLICVSEQLSRRLWWGRRKAALIPTGVDTTKFFPLPMETARRALGWSSDAQIVLFNAGHSPRVKRLDMAQEVVSFARRSLPDLQFVVLDGTVSPDDVPIVMNASNCLLLTSDMEGSPTVVQEAMACNLPVVSVPVGDVPERLEYVQPSFVLPRDSAVLAEAVLELLRNPQRSNAQEIVRAELGNEAITNAVDRVYRMVARPR